MALQDITAERSKPFHDLAAKIKQLEVCRREKIMKLAKEISDSAKTFNAGYEREDSLSMLMGVVAKALNAPNTPQSIIRTSDFLYKKVLEAARKLDITPAYVYGVVEDLERLGIKADYPSQ